MTNPIPERRTRRLRDWHHMLAMLLVMSALAVGLVFLFLKVDFIPNPASAERGLIDHFMQILFAIAAVFFAIIITVFGYALIFFRGEKGDETDSKPIRGSLPLELAWTIIPLIIVIVLSIHGAGVLDKMTSVDPNTATTQTVYSLGAFIPREVPASLTALASNTTAASANATGSSDTTSQQELVVNVDASRFVWAFSYPQYSINTTYELEVPVNRRVVFHITSEDVIHSFWVQPWGPKQDAVPGLNPDLRITPTKIGQFTVECNQLCGFGHSDMTAPVRVVSAADFATWVQQQSGGAQTTPPPGSVSFIELSAKNIAYDKSTITVAAGSKVQIRFTNNDTGIPHNFAVYTDSSATTLIFQGKIITGPATITYTFSAPVTPGNYFFRCDVHPTQMTGTLVVK